MEKIELGKWYRHRGNKNAVPWRVKKASKGWDVVAQRRDRSVVQLTTRQLTEEVSWAYWKEFDDIMAYKFVEKK